jgi:hypothetical protein
MIIAMFKFLFKRLLYGCSREPAERIEEAERSHDVFSR